MQPRKCGTCSVRAAAQRMHHFLCAAWRRHHPWNPCAQPVHPPSARRADACWCAALGRVVLLGESNAGSARFSEVWTSSTTSRVWHLLGGPHEEHASPPGPAAQQQEVMRIRRLCGRMTPRCCAVFVNTRTGSVHACAAGATHPLGQQACHEVVQLLPAVVVHAADEVIPAGGAALQAAAAAAAAVCNRRSAARQRHQTAVWHPGSMRALWRVQAARTRHFIVERPNTFLLPEAETSAPAAQPLRACLSRCTIHSHPRQWGQWGRRWHASQTACTAHCPHQPSSIATPSDAKQGCVCVASCGALKKMQRVRLVAHFGQPP